MAEALPRAARRLPRCAAFIQATAGVNDDSASPLPRRGTSLYQAGVAHSGNRAMPTREEIEAELNETPAQKFTRELAEAVLDTYEIEEMLANAEQVRGLKVSPETPIAERMARLGCSEEVCDKVAELMEALSTLRAGRPLPERLERFIDEYDATEQSADDQLAAIVERRTPRA